MEIHLQDWMDECKTECMTERQPVRVSNEQGQELWNQLYPQCIFNGESQPQWGSPVYGNVPWLLLANLIASHYVSHPASTALIVLGKSRRGASKSCKAWKWHKLHLCHAIITVKTTCRKIRKTIKGEDRSWGDWMIVLGMKKAEK